MGLILNQVLEIERPGHNLVFHVPTSALYSLDERHNALLSLVRDAGEISAEGLAAQAVDEPAVNGSFESSLRELQRLGLLVDKRDSQGLEMRMVDLPPKRKGFSTLVAHVAHSCNLGCTYCYADEGLYGGPAEMMSRTTGERYVDWLFTQSAAEQVSITFFGGEPLLNWPVVKHMARLALERAEAEGRRVTFAMTTNGTLITEKIAAELARWQCSVTVSIDGGRRTHDRMRPFHSGRGSYERIVERIQPLLDRGIAVARATMTRADTDAVRIVDELLGLGFRSVGISPVDTGDGRFDLNEDDYAKVLEGFQTLAYRYRDEAIEGRRFGFSNIEGVVNAFHAGHNKDFPCGAGVQLVAGAPNGNIHLCHRFVGDDDMLVGSLDEGVEPGAHLERMDSLKVENRTDCPSCWARYVCGGGCHHSNKTHKGDARVTYSEHCDWLRAWFRTGLEVYADISLHNPAFIEQYLDGDVPCVEG